MTVLGFNVPRTMTTQVMLLILLTCLAGCGESRERGTRNEPPEAAAKADAKDSYPLKVCVISGKLLDEVGDPVIERYDGREVRFCCTDCVDAFRQSPSQYMALLDAAVGGTEHADHADHDH